MAYLKWAKIPKALHQFLNIWNIESIFSNISQHFGARHLVSLLQMLFLGILYYESVSLSQIQNFFLVIIIALVSITSMHIQCWSDSAVIDQSLCMKLTLLL